MQEMKRYNEQEEMLHLCARAKQMILSSKYDVCYQLICLAMQNYPDAPQLHNLLGILWEKRGQHTTAMRHFRAAYALDPAYLPARQNMENFGTTYFVRKCAFDETDCQKKAACQRRQQKGA